MLLPAPISDCTMHTCGLPNTRKKTPVPPVRKIKILCILLHVHWLCVPLFNLTVSSKNMFSPRGLRPFSKFQADFGPGFGLASCPSLGFLATSDYLHDTISVWSVPLSSDCSDGGLVHVCTLGGRGSKAPMQFKFICMDGLASGYLAFIPDRPRPLLLVTDAGHNAVHTVDVVSQTHVGYVASPGTIAGPRGVAACRTSPLVAVSAWKSNDGHDHVVVVYRGSGAHWGAVRVIGGHCHPQFNMPFGLRFSADGSCICVAERGTGRGSSCISLLRVSDGRLLRRMTTATEMAFDVEGVKGGWLVACRSSQPVVFVADDFRRCVCVVDMFECMSCAVVTMPGLGVVVRHRIHGRGSPMQVLSDGDTMSMWSMSGMRVVWMTAVARGIMCFCRR